MCRAELHHMHHQHIQFQLTKTQRGRVATERMNADKHGWNPALPAGTVAFSVEQESSTSPNAPPTPRTEGSGTADVRARFPSREVKGVLAQNAAALPALLSAAGAKPARFHCADRVVGT